MAHRRSAVTVRLPRSVANAALRCASTSGLPLALWAAEVIEAFLAGERCRHGALRPEALGAEAPSETDA